MPVTRRPAMRLTVAALAAVLSGVSACGGDGPTEPEASVAGIWQGEHGSRLTLRADGETVTGTMRPAVVVGEPGPEVDLCGTFRPPTLVLAGATCSSGREDIVLQATLQSSGRVLSSQWKTNGGVGDFFLVTERFTRLP